MSWNYRVLATEHNGELYLRIHEVFYNADNEPDGYSAEPMSAQGESIPSIRKDLRKMKEALKKPVLWGDERFPAEI